MWQRGIFVAWLAMTALLGTHGFALAEPLVSLDPAPDGTLILVGSGWRPGQSMVVSVGPDMFPALADSVGEFEVQTGLISTGGPPAPLAVHRPDAQVRLAADGQPPQLSTPHAFAVLFAQSVMSGTAFLGVSAAGVVLAALATRYAHRRRGARGSRRP